MTLEQLLKICQDRGLKLELTPYGEPVLRGPKGAATPALLRCLKLHRLRIMERLSGRRVREYRWASGLTLAVVTPDAGHASAAVAWRYAGEARWRGMDEPAQLQPGTSAAPEGQAQPPAA